MKHKKIKVIGIKDGACTYWAKDSFGAVICTTAVKCVLGKLPKKIVVTLSTRRETGMSKAKKCFGDSGATLAGRINKKFYGENIIQADGTVYLRPAIQDALSELDCSEFFYWKIEAAK